MNAAKRKALDAMATGAPLYIYVEPEQFNLLYDGLVPGGCYPTPGSGVIVSDNGLMPVSRRIVAAIENLGTRWCSEWRALVMTEAAKNRVRGWYEMPADTWFPE